MNSNSPKTEDLDRLLSAYFKQQVPNPWPAAPTSRFAEPSTVAANRPAHTERVGRSSLTLAASVAALLGLGLLLADTRPQGGVAPTATDGSVLKNSTANGDKLLKHMTPEPTHR